MKWKTRQKEYEISEMKTHHLSIAYKKTIERYEESLKFFRLQDSLLTALEKELELRGVNIGKPTTPAMKERNQMKIFIEKYGTSSNK